jgi:hypothetical protein
MERFFKRLFCKHEFIDSNTVGIEICMKCLKFKEKVLTEVAEEPTLFCKALNEVKEVINNSIPKK